MWKTFSKSYLFLAFLLVGYGLPLQASAFIKSPDSLFVDRLHQILAIKKEKKRTKQLEELFIKNMNNGSILTFYSFNEIIKGNLAPLWIKYCGQIVDKLVNTQGLEVAKDWLIGLKDQGIANREVEQMLVSLIQANPEQGNPVELIIHWYALNQQWEKVWMQRKALDIRFKSGGKEVNDFGVASFQRQQWPLVNQVFDYLIKTYPRSPQLLNWKQLVLASREQSIQNKMVIEKAEFSSLIQSYRELRKDRGNNPGTAETYLSEARIFLYQLNQLDSAEQVYQKGIELSEFNVNLQAQMKLELGDVYLYAGRKYDALLQYAQVEKLVKDSPIAYEAKLKTGKLYYYTGDFELAKANFDVLKQSTQKEIANDALHLSWVIEDNTGIDTLETALKSFATIQWLYEQKKVQEADKALDELFKNQKGQSLEDDILYQMAQRSLEKKQVEQAKILFKDIYDRFDQDIYGDDALFHFLQLTDFRDKDLALQFITKYPSSIYLQDIRKHIAVPE
ncbi:tetratricopeptide repeat protein [Aquirufa ecclesiirivi]|uniref:Tetratricopeptide repeat protein n=1 Tax=Aquirufa ecclesiirivi TaxID=2715124 RepID=A0ABT4JH78_9BACT|nr:tetratricopeptide repeat protein [Aquirufa ecclesiirivi]MCZ2474911.1 tetratricopeptide repeat protein [Aquirufa ecclesiirivi]